MSVSSFGAYKHVIFFGVDGMGNFNTKTESPNMTEVFKDGAKTLYGLASCPSISAQGWASMLTGATPEAHKQTNYNMFPNPDTPTVFRFIRDARPDAELVMCADWSNIPNDIVGPQGGMSRAIITNGDDTDAELTEKVIEYLEDNKPMFMFLQFSVDHLGHRYGYGSPEHLNGITERDEMFGRIIAKLKQNGMFEDTLIMVSADHGGTYPKNGTGGNHGGWSREERYVFVGVAGKTVMKNSTIGEVCLRDFPSIMLHALGIKEPEFNMNGYSSQLPIGIFENAGIVERRDVFEGYKTYNLTKPEPDINSPKHLKNFIDINKLLLWMNFENGVCDTTGRCDISTKRGLVKTYTGGGVFGNYGELGNGSLTLQGLPNKDIFTISLWLKTTEDTRWLDVFSNKDNKSDYFSIAVFGTYAGFYLKTHGVSDFRSHLEIFVSQNVKIGDWANFIFVVDSVKNDITGYVNFKKVGSIKSDKILLQQLDFDIKPFLNLDKLYISDDQFSNESFCKAVDDIMIFDGEADIEALERYYFAN